MPAAHDVGLLGKNTVVLIVPLFCSSGFLRGFFRRAIYQFVLTCLGCVKLFQLRGFDFGFIAHRVQSPSLLDAPSLIDGPFSAAVIRYAVWAHRRSDL